MKLKSVKESFRSFRESMKGMTLEERIDHIWAYYKWELLIIVLIPIVIFALISWLCATPIQTAFGGNLTNSQITQSGYDYLTVGYLQTLGLDSGGNRVTLGTATTAGTDAVSVNATGVDGGVRVAVMVADGSLDYIIADSVALEFYTMQGAYENIETVLTAEQLAPFADKLYYQTDEESGQRIPIAIDISELPFADDCLEDGKTLYLGFPIHAPHPEQQAGFFDYLLAWGT